MAYIHSVVFIHGLQGHPRDTWTARSIPEVEKSRHKIARIFFPSPSRDQVSSSNDTTSQKRPIFWPEDLLPKECSHARIMTFGYDSDFTKFFKGPANQDTFYQHANALLFALDRARRQDVGH